MVLEEVRWLSHDKPRSGRVIQRGKRALPSIALTRSPPRLKVPPVAGTTSLVERVSESKGDQLIDNVYDAGHDSTGPNGAIVERAHLSLVFVKVGLAALPTQLEPRSGRVVQHGPEGFSDRSRRSIHN